MKHFSCTCAGVVMPQHAGVDADYDQANAQFVAVQDELQKYLSEQARILRLTSFSFFLSFAL